MDKVGEIPEEMRKEIDDQMSEAIYLTFQTMGLEVDDRDVIDKVKQHLRNKLQDIVHNVTYENSDSQEVVLELKHLKSALEQFNVRIHRPEYIIDMPQSPSKSMNTRTRKNHK